MSNAPLNLAIQDSSRSVTHGSMHSKIGKVAVSLPRSRVVRLGENPPLVTLSSCPLGIVPDLGDDNTICHRIISRSIFPHKSSDDSHGFLPPFKRSIDWHSIVSRLWTVSSCSHGSKGPSGASDGNNRKYSDSLFLSLVGLIVEQILSA